ncbi:MAG: GNAT family N-acetyltransferase [Nocardioidaceae bacterium]
MEVRPARPEEYAAVGDLTVEAYVAGGHLSADHRYTDTLRDAARRAREAVLLVAVEDGLVLGTVTYCPHGSPWRELGRDDEGEFRSLAVSPDAQGRGVGEALVRECIRRSVADGDRGMVLCSLTDQTRAHGVYGRLGFVRDPSRDWSPSPDDRLLAFARTHEVAPGSAEVGVTAHRGGTPGSPRGDSGRTEVGIAVVGGEARRSFTVTEADTAAAVGSGSLPVLGTPVLLAWCEAATCSALADSLEEGQTSVGTGVRLEHLAASPVGEVVQVVATLTDSEGRVRHLDVRAERADGTLLGRGQVTRAVVDAERFLARLARD